MNDDADDALEVLLLSAPRAARAERLDALFVALDSHSGPLAPQHISEKGEPPYSKAALRKWAASPPRHPAMAKQISLFRREPPVSYTIALLPPGKSMDLEVRMSIAMQWFTVDGEARAQMLIALVRAMAGAMQSEFGYAHSRNDLSVGRDLHYTDPYAPVAIVETHWVDVLGPSLVEELGRERVMASPAKVTALAYGGVLIETSQTPLDCLSPASRVVQARVLAYLTGEDEGAAAARLAERSARLAPVVHAFDPDIAELLERIVATVDWGDRAREVARWNGFHPAEPAEWRPADQALPADVDDVEAVVERYDSLYAEQLAALLHKEVPGVGEARPEALPLVDFHFWLVNYPVRFPRSHIDADLVPAVGAWLGKVLVRNLGGVWVPRRALDEAQVIVGQRAWLPFRRARHYLADRDSVINCSLTQLYRVAAGHR